MPSKSWIFCYCLPWCLQVYVLRTDATCDYQSLPSHCLAESRQLYNHSAKCPGHSNHVQPFVECSYKLGQLDDLPTVSSCRSSNYFPGKSFELQWSIYTVKYESRCVYVFNITWQLPQEGSSNFLTGFALRVEYVSADLNRTIGVRIFNIGFSPSHPPDLEKTLFYYDCFPTLVGHVHRITVFSLPLSPPTAKIPNKSVVFVKPEQHNDDKADVFCNKSWIARATIMPSPEDATINVSFDRAADCYKFDGYIISLVKYDSGRMNLIIQRATVFHSRNVVKLHHFFTNVSPDLITVMIRPFINESCGCLSSSSSSPAAAAFCRPCTVTSISYINMNIPPDDVPPTCPPPETWVVWHLVAAAVGVLVAVILVVLIIACEVRRRQKQKLSVFLPDSEGDDDNSSINMSPSEFNEVYDKENNIDGDAGNRQGLLCKNYIAPSVSSLSVHSR